MAAVTSGSNLSVTGSLDYAQSTRSITSQDALDALRLSVGMDTQGGTSTGRVRDAAGRSRVGVGQTGGDGRRVHVHRIHDERACVAGGGDFAAGVPNKRHPVDVFYPDVADIVLKLGKLERVV